MRGLKKTIGVIGFGRFGRLLTEVLKTDFSMIAYDAKISPALRRGRGSLAQAASCDIVVFCVPIGRMEESLQQARRYIKKGAWVFDVCSVKEYPARLMRRLLPGHCDIIGTHPLFGPGSFAHPDARQVVLCPIRTNHLAAVISYLRRRGFEAVTASPVEHDRRMALALNLPHLVGRALQGMRLKAQGLSTLNYERLLSIAQSVSGDSLELDHDIRRYNRFSSKMERFFKTQVLKALRPPR
ncbi:MAG TPA: prephenate dehydrogenase/arogenate dehydrogenase family protein [Elusimicrobia bacterium]|nr:prephenate dehydrogenase/arogenate dehydrogenase family protein [Elusimicrobiota bacterium]HBT60364.1 prephenate dehydrogenase/arogenate dehydrogenase family protein [Elusimicrobiota bacterium]